MAIEFNDQPNKVIIDEQSANRITVEEQNTHVEIAIGGPQGARGPQGIQGPPGTGTTPEEIVALTSYTHNQIASSTTWTVNHGLTFKPNVTVFDSAGTQLEAEIVHNDNNSLTINFSASMSGKAYLS
jgi:hypothetical protein